MSKLIIKDLSFEAAKLAIGDSSLANVAKDGDLFSEFAGQDLSVDAVEWLISQEEKPDRDVYQAKALLRTNNVAFDESMDEEVIILLAEQYMDDITNVKGWAQNRSEGVLV